MHFCKIKLLTPHKTRFYYSLLKDYVKHMASADPSWGGMAFGPITVHKTPEEWNECIVKYKFDTLPTISAKSPSFKWVSL
jgi:hypothetical protein